MAETERDNCRRIALSKLCFVGCISDHSVFVCAKCGEELATEPTCLNLVGCPVCSTRNDIPETARNRAYRDKLMRGFC